MVKMYYDYEKYLDSDLAYISEYNMWHNCLPSTNQEP